MAEKLVMENQPPQSWLMLVSLVILFSSCFSQSSNGLFARSQQQHASTLIQKACNQSSYTDLCISSLESDPRSISADLKGLTVIAIDIAKANGTAILDYITNELIGNSTVNVSHSITSCQLEYQNAVRDLGQATVIFNGEDYRNTNMLIGAAEGDIDDCKSDESIVVQEVPPLLLQMSEIMFKLCSNALAVLCQYADKGCGITG